MKTFIKLIFLGLVIAVAWRYLENNNINIEEKLADSVVWMKHQLKEIKSSAIEEPAISVEQERSEIRQPDPLKENVSPVTENVSEDNDNNQISRGIITSSSTGFPAEPVEMNEIQKVEPVLITGSSEEAIEWVKAATEKYSPDSWYMLMQYDGLPAISEAISTDGQTASSNKPADTFHYLEGGSLSQMIASMATNVHEISHGSKVFFSFYPEPLEGCG